MFTGWIKRGSERQLFPLIVNVYISHILVTGAKREIHTSHNYRGTFIHHTSIVGHSYITQLSWDHHTSHINHGTLIHHTTMVGHSYITQLSWDHHSGKIQQANDKRLRHGGDCSIWSRSHDVLGPVKKVSHVGSSDLVQVYWAPIKKFSVSGVEVLEGRSHDVLGPIQ